MSWRSALDERLPHPKAPRAALRVRGWLRLRGRFRGRRGLLAFLAVMGPGLIAGIAGNDAGGVTTHSVMGASTRLTPFWSFPITIALLAILPGIAAPPRGRNRPGPSGRLPR